LWGEEAQVGGVVLLRGNKMRRQFKAVNRIRSAKVNRTEKRKGMKRIKKQDEWKLPPASTTTLVAKPFEGYGHEPDCTCNRKTTSFIDKALRKLDFLELTCPFDVGDHDVVVPRGLDSQNDQDRIRALDNYAELERQLNEAGLVKNADRVHDNIHEYLDHGLNGKIFFHPDPEEVPVGLLTKKQRKAHYDQVANETKAKVKEFIPTLPKNSMMITVLTNDPEVKDGVLGTVSIWDDGSFHADVPKERKITPQEYLEQLFSFGLFMSQYGTGVDYIAVVKTGSDVKYIRLFDGRIFEMESELGRKWAMEFLKYRNKSFADIFAKAGSTNDEQLVHLGTGTKRFTSPPKLPKNRMMFYIAYIEKNDLLLIKDGIGKKEKAAA
jgi:hypothetical protein